MSLSSIELRRAVAAVGIWLWLPAGLVAASAADLQAPAASATVRSLAQLFAAPATTQEAGKDVPESPLELRLRALPANAGSVGDITEALLIAGYDIFRVVRDVILAYGTGGNGPGVAAEAASRALFVRGLASRHLVDAGVLAAAAEIGRRRNPVAEPASEEQRRSTDEESRADVERQREEAAEVAAGLVPEVYSTPDAAVYATLFSFGLVQAGVFDNFLDIGADAGAAASIP